jgi:hypothetical protein
MSFPDLLVGGISILLGSACLVVSVAPLEWLYQLPKVQWIERKGGRVAARVFYGVLGCALIAWGAIVASGWKWAAR